MRINFYPSSRERINGKSAGAKITATKGEQPPKPENSSATKLRDINPSAFDAAPDPRLPTSSSTKAMSGLTKLILDAKKGGRLNRNLERRIDAIQAIAILILNAKTDEVDHLLGLEEGTDDGRTKAFGRGAANLLRLQAAEELALDEFTFRKLHLDVSRHKVTVENNPVALTTLEFKLLTQLAQRRGRVQTRERLLKHVWDYNVDVDTRTVDTHIQRLRKKLGPARKYIATVRGVGYQFLES